MLLGDLHREKEEDNVLDGRTEMEQRVKKNWQEATKALKGCGSV